MATRAGARPTVDVVLTHAADEPGQKVHRLAVKPQMEKVELAPEDQGLIGAAQPGSDFGGSDA